MAPTKAQIAADNARLMTELSKLQGTPAAGPSLPAAKPSLSAAKKRMSQAVDASSPSAVKTIKFVYSKAMVEFEGSKSAQQLGQAWSYVALDFNFEHAKDLKGVAEPTGASLSNKYTKLVAEFNKIMKASEVTGNPDDNDELDGDFVEREPVYVFDYEKLPAYWEALLNYLGDKKGMSHVDYGQAEGGKMVVTKPRMRDWDSDSDSDCDLRLDNLDSDVDATKPTGPVVPSTPRISIPSSVSNKAQSQKERQAETDRAVKKQRLLRAETPAAKGKASMVTAMSNFGEGIERGLMALGTSLSSRTNHLGTLDAGPSAVDMKLEKMLALLEKSTAPTAAASAMDAKFDSMLAAIYSLTQAVVSQSRNAPADNSK
ncbi:hypothetical protein HDU98_002567 [Podochytrium sp. JEL0797]|nr:hypothetical protein HDU98_002567 [Podochytrium sp. JEL0797]